MKHELRIVRSLLLPGALVLAVSADPFGAPAEAAVGGTARCDRQTVRGSAAADIDQYLTRAVPFGFSGTLYVRDRDGILIHKAYGAANQSTGAEINLRTVFDMGSITKAFTATAIALLEAEGRLSTADTIGRHFPDAPADKKDITLDQVLTHSAGLIDFVIEDDYAVIQRDEFVRGLMAAPLLDRPGKSWSYSNGGYSLLSAVIERVSDKPYEVFLRDQLLAPAGMVETGYRLPRWTPARVARTYSASTDHGTPLERLTRTGGPHWILLGNGGMLTTSIDMCRFDHALTQGSLVPPAVKAKLFAGRFPRREGMSQGYAWTEEKFPEGVAYHHGGDAPNYGVNAEYRTYPALDLSLVILANSRHKGASTRRSIVPRVVAMVTGGDKPSPPAVTAAPAAELSAFAGTYGFGASRLEVRARKGHLLLQAFGQDAIDLVTFARAPTSRRNRRTMNERAEKFLQAAIRGDEKAAAEYIGEEGGAPRFVAALGQMVTLHGPVRGIEILGTARLDRGVFRTTARIRFERLSQTIRFGWTGNKLGIDSDDAALPGIGGVVSRSPIEAVVEEPAWKTGFRTYAAYDLQTDETMRITFATDSAGRTEAMILHLPQGSVAARRLR